MCYSIGMSNKERAKADEANRRARLYAITASGRRQLARERAAWDRMAAIIHTLLHRYARG